MYIIYIYILMNYYEWGICKCHDHPLFKGRSLRIKFAVAEETVRDLRYHGAVATFGMWISTPSNLSIVEIDLMNLG